MKFPFLGPKHPKAKPLENPWGISTVYTPNGPHKVDIIFTHGLGGGSRKTWAQDPCEYSTFWPGQWLPHEEGFQDARVHTFGYNANFHLDPTTYAIIDFGRELISSLWSSELKFGEVPIILVGHSMGGLVSKQAYIIGRNNPQNFARITPAIKAMLFLATPHAGSSHSKVLNKLLGVVPSRGRQQYVRDLNISSATIKTIDELFRGAMGGLMLASLYEVFPLKITPLYNKMIVEKHHAILGVPDEIVRPMDANHRTICKFSSKQDPNYIAVVNVLRMLVLQVLAEEQRKSYVDPFEIPPFRGKGKSPGGEKGNVRGEGTTNLQVPQGGFGAEGQRRHAPGYASSSSSGVSTAVSSPSTGRTIILEAPIGVPGPSRIRTSVATPRCPIETEMGSKGMEAVSKSCKHCAHCEKATLHQQPADEALLNDLEGFKPYLTKPLRARSF